MRFPLVTPLESRDGTVEKDERLVNAYAELDAYTQNVYVYKRAGLDEGNAVLVGNDIYGQGIFEYDGYWYAIIGDALFWYNVSGEMQGGISFGGTAFYDSVEFYEPSTIVYHDGQQYYSVGYSTGTEPGTSGVWQETEPTGTATVRPEDVGEWGTECEWAYWNPVPYWSCGATVNYSSWNTWLSGSFSNGARCVKIASTGNAYMKQGPADEATEAPSGYETYLAPGEPY